MTLPRTPRQRFTKPTTEPYAPPPRGPTNATYATLCAKALYSWSCGVRPDVIADELLTHQSECPVDLGDMAFALRGLGSFNRHGPLSAGLSSVTRPQRAPDLFHEAEDEPPSVVSPEEDDPSLAKLDADLAGWELLS